MLDLVKKKKKHGVVQPSNSQSSGGKVTISLEIELKNWKVLTHKGEHKEGRLNHAKLNFDGLNKFSGSIDWKTYMEGKTAQEKYEFFL